MFRGLKKKELTLSQNSHNLSSFLHLSKGNIE